ncbi:hypothetical protein ACFOTA_23375 [Chitinophaga sp. GCM10012297]|uniref:Lipocalin-like domain-containing protein n=1 Tax=Chitinophaga chungangae TaxID=2821488 RepID=A0ABS3YKI3_9BACT|nr:hypothetical protein [Chitinophaga chungangae]MBO9155171.1 hypothetical protein [Chitinophaga chungangae]
MKKFLVCGLIVLLAFQACKKNKRTEPEKEQPPKEIVDDSPPDYDNPDGEWTLTQWVSGDFRRHYSYAPGRKLIRVSDNYQRPYYLTYDVNNRLRKIARFFNMDSLLVGHMDGKITLISIYDGPTEFSRDSILYNEDGKIGGIVWYVNRIKRNMFKYEWEGDNVVSTARYDVWIWSDNDRDTTYFSKETYTYDNAKSPWKTNGNICFEWFLNSEMGELLSANNLVRIEHYQQDGKIYRTDSLSYTYENGLPKTALSTSSRITVTGVNGTNNFFYKKK